MKNIITAIGQKTKIIAVSICCFIATGLVLLSLPVYAEDQKVVNHSFSFGDWGENKGIKVLDYRYGNSKTPITYVEKARLEDGNIPQSAHVGGFFPVGDSLHVKWRVEATGKIYEDTVDLKNKLPSDMKDQRIHFLIKGSQLYVYLISEKPGLSGIHTDCPVHVYYHNKCTELYPEHWQNF